MRTMPSTRKEEEPARTDNPRENFLCAGVVFFAALALYAWTRAPTVTLVDSGELAVVAHTWGVAHPPGFPLWVMLAHFASLLPYGNVATRIHLSSGLFGAVAAGLTTLVAIEVIGALSPFGTDGQRPGMQRHRGNRLQNRAAIDVPAASAGLLIAFSRTLWSYAVVTEVYALNAALVLLIFFLMLRWRRRRLQAAHRNSGSAAAANTGDSPLYVAAALFGLALGVHHVTVGLLLPAFAVLVYRTAGMRFFKGLRFAWAAIVSIAALIAVYSYLPIAASHLPIINWGAPVSLEAIWAHITGRQYQAFLTFEPAMIGQQTVDFARMVLREFSWPWLPITLLLSFAGFWSAFKRDRTLFWFLGVLIAADLGYCLNYSIAEDKDAYYLTTFIVLAITAGVGLHQVVSSIWVRSRGPTAANAAAALLLFVLPGLALAANWPFNNRRHYWVAHDYVGNIFRSVEPRSLLLTFDWQVCSPMFYAQRIEQRRTDVKVVDINLLRRSWYFDYLRHAYPDLIAASAPEVEAFVAELKHWEQEPAAYENNEARTSINSRFQEMMTSFVKAQYQTASVYVTVDFLTPPESDRQLTTSITGQYGLVPEGLVFKLTNSQTVFESPRRIRIETRGLNDGTLRFDKDDVVRTKVFPVYTTMMMNRGRYYAQFGHHQEAVEAFQEALALNPTLSAAKTALAESERQFAPK